MPDSNPDQKLDPMAKLKALTRSRTGDAPFEHENEDSVLRKLLGVLNRIPTGKTLVNKSLLYGVSVKLLKGKNDFSYAPPTNTVFVGMPATQDSIKARMLLHLAMGLEEARQEAEGPARPDFAVGRAEYIRIHEEKQHDILFVMCTVAHELINTLGLREVLDELTKMGHNELYEAYEKDIREGQK